MSICPKGWHVPSSSEWDQLLDYVGNQSEYMCGVAPTNIAKALASTMGWWEMSNENDCSIVKNVNENNATGFSVLPVSFYRCTTDYGFQACFWSTTSFYSSSIYYYGFR